MAEITSEAVRALREKTDLPMMECKKALTEANGDEALAIKLLRERVKNLTVKLEGRTTSEGRVATMVSDDGTKACMVEVQCETNPVAKNDDFLFMCQQLCKQLLVGPGASTPDELLSQPVPDKPGSTLKDIYEETLNKIRERIVVSRIITVPGPVGVYTHHDGKMGVVFQATGDGKAPDLLRDVAMHIAALGPKCTLPDGLDPELVAAEKKKCMEEARASGKPENILEKIVAGKLTLFYGNEGVLVAQPFAKDQTKTVEKVLAEKGYTAKGFTRWRIGQ